MKLFLFSLISVLFVIALADTKTCVGSRCKRMTKVMANLYNDYGYGYGGGNGGGGNGGGGNGGGGNGGGGNGSGGNGVGGNGGGSNNNQNRESDCPNCYARDFGNGDYSHNTINIEKK